MSALLKIQIPYTPKAKASVRSGQHGYYNPSCRGMLQTREYVRSCIPKQDGPLFKGPLLVICHFQIPSPKHVLRRRRDILNFHPHIKRPDGDNLEKFLNDALNGIIWSDDSHIAWLLRSKSTTSDPIGATTIIIREIDEAKPDYQIIVDTIIDHIELPNLSNGLKKL